MGALQELALCLDAEERTLRRAVSQGTVRARRPGPRRLHLADGESEYLQGHWALLAELRRTLRTQRNVRLAVLYGSVARGEEDEGSDLDLLVSLAAGRPSATSRLAASLEAIASRPVDVALLSRVEARAPLLLARVLDEGRVIVDRDGQWPALRARRRSIRARADRSHRRQMAAAARAISELAS